MDKQPVDMWTRPTDQPAPFGTCGQAMDNKKTLSTAGPHSLASRPHTHRLNNNDSSKTKNPYPQFMTHVFSGSVFLA